MTEADTWASFCRTAAGAEIGLVLTLPGGKIWAIEIKRSLAPTVSKGFHLACEDIRPDRQLVVYPGAESFSLGREITAVPLYHLAAELAQKTSASFGS